MKGLFVTIAVMVILALTPVFAYAQTGQEATLPSLSQPLVREGTLAVSLAQDLKVGSPASEAEAESELSAVGIAPRNGWIADYPVTPDIIGELRASISDAAGSGRISMGREAALTAFNGVLAGNKLDVRAGGSVENAETAPPDYPDTAVANNYYYDEGPPVVTYYAPPPDYAYLYTWVAYPFWWYDFWFPGFFVLADFDIELHGHHHHHDHEFRHDRDEFVSNHFRDPHTGRFSRVDPAHRLRGGQTGTIAERGGRWADPSARRGAAAIFSRSRSASVGSAGRSSVPYSGSGRIAAAPIPGRSFSSPARSISPTLPSGGRVRGSASVGSGRLYTYSAPPRYTSRFGVSGRAQSFGGRTFSAPTRTYSAPTRTFSAPAHSSNAPMRSFSAPRASISSGSIGGGSWGGRGSFGGGGRSFGGGWRR